MEKILVTGGAGFIGSHVVEKLLEKGYKVAVLDNLSTGKKDNIKGCEVEFYYCDITDVLHLFQVVETFQPDYIIHLAAQVSVSDSVKNITHDSMVNIQGSVNVIEAAKKYNVKRIVFSSTAAVYGNPEYLPIDTDHKTEPTSPYGLAKYTVEKYLQLAYELYGLDYTILRYSNVYGPRQDSKGEGGVVAIFANKLSNQERPVIYGDGNQTRDFVYVEDVAEANVLSIKNNRNGIYNVSTCERISINDLLKSMFNFNNNGIEPIYKEERQGDIKHSVLNNKDTFSRIGWCPKTVLDKGIELTLKYYLRTSAL